MLVFDGGNLRKLEWWESLNETKIKQAQNNLKQTQRKLKNKLDEYDDYKLAFRMEQKLKKRKSRQKVDEFMKCSVG